MVTWQTYHAHFQWKHLHNLMRSVTDICHCWGKYLYENSITLMKRFTFIFVQISSILRSQLPVSFSLQRPLLNWTNYQIPWVLSRDEKSIRLRCCWRFFIISKEWNLYWNKKKRKLSNVFNGFSMASKSSINKS